MTRILFLVGSLRAESFNRRLSLVAERMLPEGYEATRYDLSAIPLYNGDHEGEKTPASVVGLRQAMSGADGVFWTMPEYNYAIPGVVKNAIDWASRPMLPRNSMVGKPMNVVVATGSANNGIRALVDLKRTWTNCGGAPVGFDFVLQLAATRFIDEGGHETLEPVSRAKLQFNIDNLIRSIEGDGGAVASANWDGFVRSMT